MKTCYTLFRGGGGADIGLEAAGYTSIGGIEINAAIAAVCDRNFPHSPTLIADICAVDPYLLPERPTHLHVSPSCKNASVANTDAGEAPEDRDAGVAVERFLGAWLPETFSLENVWQYRHFDAFKGICAALQRLGYSYEYWHLNAADMGVPQTRKRLILLARRGQCHIQRPAATHTEGGDWFSAPWVGWYEAIKDLIPTLPASKFADWQMKRLPNLADSSLLFGNNDPEWGEPYKCGAHPAFSITTQTGPRARAFILEGTGAADDRPLVIRGDDDPMWTIRSAIRSDTCRAFLVSDQSAEWGGIGVQVRWDDEPTTTIRADRQAQTRAFLVGSDSHKTGGNRKPISIRCETEPVMSLTGSAQKCRAWLATGRVVRMTPRALSRFMSFPDSYWLPDKAQLACQIIGNAVCPLLMQRIMESL